MSIAPLPVRRLPNARTGAPVTRTVGGSPVRVAPSPSRIARRRLMVNLAKRVLPAIALLLLGSLAVWPELQRESGQARLLGSASVTPDNGQLLDARYNGVDVHDRPYTMTAKVAHQVDPDRIDLTDIKGDLGGGQPGWVLVQSQKGVYGQHEGQLDMSGDVKLYRDDGTTMFTDTATVDLKAGAATGADKVHVEGPFGQLDAQGFALTDRGGVIQFTGPGHLVLNSRSP